MPVFIYLLIKIVMTKEEQLKVFQDFSNQFSEIMLSKGMDYAQDDDVLSNFKLVAEICGTTPGMIAMVHMATEVVRLGNLLNRGTIPNNESIAESAMDLGMYSMLFMMLKIDEPKTAYSVAYPVNKVS
jgi:hypothetical protein